MRNQKLRRKFAINHLKKDESWWNDVIFRDESKFGNDGRVDGRSQNVKPIALKFAYLKAMSYQFCCMVQALEKPPNQLPPNFKSL